MSNIVMQVYDIRYINRAIRSGQGRVYVNEDEQGCGKVLRARRTWKGQLQAKLADGKWYTVPYVSIVWGEAGTGTGTGEEKA